jgi:hypothetical protein
MSRNNFRAKFMVNVWVRFTTRARSNLVARFMVKVKINTRFKLRARLIIVQNFSRQDAICVNTGSAFP